MLNGDQINYLSKLCNGAIHITNDINIPTGIVLSKDKKIKIDYKAFKIDMGLDDIRFNWMLGKGNYIAGGSVLNWIMNNKDNYDGDTDFYFRNESDIENFITFLTNLCNFKFVRNSNYAHSYFNEDSKSTIQVVNGMIKLDNNEFRKLVGKPFDILKYFDIGICKFAIDNSNLYTYASSIKDLLTKNIKTNCIWNKSLTIERILKYYKRGFYFNNKLISYNNEGDAWEKDNTYDFDMVCDDFNF